MRGPTDNMNRVLREIAEGKGTHHNLTGQAEHGGRLQVLVALRRRGLIDREGAITDAGAMYLARIQEAKK